MMNFLSNYYNISWWTEEMKVKMQFFDGRPLSGSIPKQVTCIIKETQDRAATPRYGPQLARCSFVCSHKFSWCAWSYLCGFYMFLIAILNVEFFYYWFVPTAMKYTCFNFSKVWRITIIKPCSSFSSVCCLVIILV